MKIKNHMQHELVLACINELMVNDPPPGTFDGDHLMEMADAVEVFEEKHFCIGRGKPITHSENAHDLAEKFLTKVWKVSAKDNLDPYLMLNLINKEMRRCYGEGIGFKEG